MKKLTYIIIFVFSLINMSLTTGVQAQNKMFTKDKLKQVKPFSQRKFTSKTASVNLQKTFNKYRRQETKPVRLRKRGRTTSSVELMRNKIRNFNKKQKIDIKTLTVTESELPKDLIFSRIPKFPENPALIREDRDMKRISKEAFDMELYWRYWDSINLTLLTDGLNESISYYIISIKFKTPVTPLMKKEILFLKEFMQKITGEEYILKEKLPYIIIIASDMQGEDQFANVKELDKILDKKLNPETKEKKGTEEVKLIDKKERNKIIKNTSEIKIEKKNKGK